MDHVALSSHCASPPRPGTRNPVERTWNYANRLRPPRARTPLTDPAPARDRRAPRAVGPSSSSPAPPRADPGPLTTTPGEKGSVRAAGTWSAGPSVMVCPSRLLVCLKGLGADDPLHRRAPHGTTHLEGYSAGSWRRSPWTTCVPLDHGGPIVVLEGGVRVSASGARRRRAPRPARSSLNPRARLPE